MRLVGHGALSVHERAEVTVHGDVLFGVTKVDTVLFSEGVRKGRISEERFVEVTSTAAAKTFGLYPERGVVREGSVADLVILDPNLERTASAEDDPSRSDYTP